MKRRLGRGVGWALTLALGTHLLLFGIARPVDGTQSVTPPRTPPRTQYRLEASDAPQRPDADVRSIASPVLFALPSPLGFSRDLLNVKLHTRLTFRQPEESESFLPVRPGTLQHKARLVPTELMITAQPARPPSPPRTLQEEEGLAGLPRRINLSSDLRERLVGGIVLPQVLNQAQDSEWVVHAEVVVSEAGWVQHVFLEEPLMEEALNLEVMRMLHGLRFKPSDHSTHGWVEIYSVGMPSLEPDAL